MNAYKDGVSESVSNSLIYILQSFESTKQLGLQYFIVNHDGAHLVEENVIYVHRL